MERERVNSSKIRAVGYDPKSQLLEIEFSDGKVIQYRGVSPEVHRQFEAIMEAERINQIASTLAGLNTRSEELRRYL